MNILPHEKQIAAIGASAEGSSIRSVERLTGIHRDTIMRLGVRVGEACDKVMNDTMRDLPCQKIEVDEIWGYIGKKQRVATPQDKPDLGDVWTFVAIDPETKAVPAYLVGKRDYASTRLFVADVSARMKNRIQLSSDSMQHYLDAVEKGFGGEVDYGQIVKVYRTTETAVGTALRRLNPFAAPPSSASRDGFQRPSSNGKTSRCGCTCAG